MRFRSAHYLDPVDKTINYYDFTKQANALISHHAARALGACGVDCSNTPPARPLALCVFSCVIKQEHLVPDQPKPLTADRGTGWHHNPV